MFDDVIREHGWAVQGVCNPRGSHGPSGWVYTIGLEDRDRPELLIVGPADVHGARSAESM